MPPAKSPFPRESATRFQRRVRSITAASTVAVSAGLLLFADWGDKENVFSGVRPVAKKFFGALFPADEDDEGEGGSE